MLSPEARFSDSQTNLEFFVESELNLIHFRSASRIGHSDLGVNRARMTDFRERFEREVATAGALRLASAKPLKSDSAPLP